jgi:hypothetical protein
MSTRLTLDTPQARRALRRCVGLLLRWAEDEAEATDDVDKAGEPGTSAASNAPAAKPDAEGVWRK